MKNLKYIILTLSLLTTSYHAELVLIVHKDFPMDKISKKSLKKIYRNKMKKWKHGGSIVRSFLKKGKTHKVFCKVLKKSPSKLDRFWLKQVFTGKGAAPESFSNGKAMIAFIAENKNALGYVDSSIDTSNVKIISLK